MTALGLDPYIKSKDLRIGDTVYIHKAGDVIPEVVKPALEDRGDIKLFYGYFKLSNGI